jgi:WD40 repeat protein
MFSPDSRFLVVAGHEKPGPGSGHPTLLIAKLAEARVVARLPSGGDWAIGPAGKVLVVSETTGDQPALRAYALATGRQIGEFTSPIPDFFPSFTGGGNSLPTAVAPDDRVMAVPLLKGSSRRREWKLCVWHFDDGRATSIPIDGNWEPSTFGIEGWLHFNAAATRLAILLSRKTGQAGPNADRHVIELWDLAGPSRLMSTADTAPELDGHPPRLSFNPAQSVFVTYHGTQNNPDGIGAIVWETSTGRVLTRFKASAMGPRVGAGDGDYLRGYENNMTTLTSISTREVRAVPGQYEYFFGVPGLRTAVSRGTTRTQAGRVTRVQPNVTLTDLETGRTRAVLTGEGELPTAWDAGGKLLSRPFSPDGKRVATQTLLGSRALNVWEVETGRLLRSVPSFNAPLDNAHFSPDGRRLAFNLNDRFRVLDIETGRVVAIDDRPGHRRAIRAVDISPDGALVASAGDDAAVCLWQAKTGRFVAMLEEETNPIAAIAFSPDGRSLAARAATGRVRAWRLDRTRAGDRIKVVAAPAWDTTSLGSAAGASATSGPVFVSQGRLVAFGAGDGTVLLRNAANGRIERALKPESGKAAATALSVGPDRQRLAAADAEGIIRVWDLSAETPSARLVTGQETIRSISIAGNSLAVAGDSLDLWDVERGERLVTLEADARSVNCLELSADGRILASGDDRKVNVRDIHELRNLLAEIELGW